MVWSSCSFIHSAIEPTSRNELEVGSLPNQQNSRLAKSSYSDMPESGLAPNPVTAVLHNLVCPFTDTPIWHLQNQDSTYYIALKAVCKHKISKYIIFSIYAFYI